MISMSWLVCQGAAGGHQEASCLRRMTLNHTDLSTFSHVVSFTHTPGLLQRSMQPPLASRDLMPRQLRVSLLGLTVDP